MRNIWAIKVITIVVVIVMFSVFFEHIFVCYLVLLMFPNVLFVAGRFFVLNF